MQSLNQLMDLPPLEQVMEKSPLTVTPDRKAIEVIVLMRQIRGGGCQLACLLLEAEELSAGLLLESRRNTCILVVENKKLLGIFTERDVVKLTSTSRDLAGVKIGEVMTKQVITLKQSPKQNLLPAILLLRQRRISHLPIVDKQNQVVGLLSLDNIRQVLKPAHLLKIRNVGEIMTYHVVQAPGNTSALALAQLMAKNHVSCVVIVEPRDDSSSENQRSLPVGILTEGDLVQLQVLELNLAKTQAKTVMSSPLCSIKPSDSLWTAYQTMQAQRVRRLVVTDEQGELVGLISQNVFLQIFDPLEMSEGIFVLQEQVERQTAQLRQVNQQLQKEIGLRKKIEVKLCQHQEQLEQKVEQRTQQLLQTNQNLQTEIREREQIAKALRESEQQYQILAEIAPVGIFRTDAQGECTYVNERWCQIAGLTVAEAKGLGWIRSIHPEDREMVSQEWERTAQGKSVFRCEYRFQHPDGQLTWVLGQGVAVFNQEGEIRGYVGTITDISESKHAEKALQEAKEKAETASQAKSEFLAHMSHELRTPLNAILGFCHLLQKIVTKPQQLSYLRSIGISGQLLLTLINDILDLAKIEAGKLPLHYEPINLRQLIAEVKQMFSVKAGEKQLLLLTEIDPQLPQLIEFDPIRLRQILFNVVSNALKFTETGYVKIVARCREDRQDREKKELEIIVEDTGIGIAASEQQRIFEAFVQSQQNNSFLNTGTGLGLTITKKLTTMLNGSLELESELGKGSSFRFLFPGVKSLQSVDSTLEVPNLELDIDLDRFSPLTVLLVDDVVSNRELIEEYFAETRHRLLLASNGYEAIALVKIYHPDVILLDLRMPQIDGKEVAQRLKQEEATQDIPIIIVTASVFQEEKDALEGLCQGFLTKPVSQQNIVSELKKLFPDTDEQVNQSPLVQPELSVAIEPESLTEIEELEAFISDFERDLAQFPPLTIVVVDDIAANRELLQEYFANSHHQVFLAANGQEAIELISTVSPDAILLDLKIPQMDGKEIARHLKQNELTRNIPIIFLTAYLPEVEESELQLLCQGFLTKPLSPTALVSVLKQIIF